jgi:hypothetical protein
LGQVFCGDRSLITFLQISNLALSVSLFLLICAYLSALALLSEDYSRPPMAAAVQDVIMLLGDSITQGGWEPGAFAQRLARQFELCQEAFLS